MAVKPICRHGVPTLVKVGTLCPGARGLSPSDTEMFTSEHRKWPFELHRTFISPTVLPSFL
eukprot:CAMPEP_0198455072 /NCGR_PEP_ID=MMETSP1453-20131121/17094_1 /TAXON_ID=1461543 ORGANISM="Unidentified sp., Strain RCC701" /NCGR_SAMPLE_ID=MMETSP1453 /ASSEMBLY_ACC=CAM_ASM_001118 /LENGTH=60 /DNA_ID=CAMNT_0044179329 /DNA_START=122 /DNA_END=300 /DNA_ORIENTATION=-